MVAAKTIAAGVGGHFRQDRTLLQRREATRTLMESDYLLRVYDGHRMGGLRFKYAGGPFLDDQKENAIPTWTSLRALEQASLHLENKNAEEDPQFSNWLKLLVMPGSSLGGARPKAGVVDTKGNLWIAKFPSQSDEMDVGAWEAVVHDLAVQCGMRVPETQIEKFGKKHHTFLSRRFDRFRLASDRAKSILEKIKKEVAAWRRVARHYGIPKPEQDMMESCFRV